MELKLAYIGLTLITNLFIIFIGFTAINKSIRPNKNSKSILVLGLLFWQVFIFFIASTGIIKSYDFPPLFAILFIAPSFIFTGVFLSRNKNKQWIQNIPQHWIVYFQSFRIAVESIFVWSVAEGILNYQVTIEGYNFDMILGISAPFIAYLAYTKKVISSKIVLIWNYIGLAILFSVILLFLTSIYAPELYGSKVPLIPLESMSYPYVLVAGFLMPVAVFLHFLSIIQIRKEVPTEV